MKKILNEYNQIHNFISSSGSGTVINYVSDFLTSYGSDSGSTSQKVTVPVPQRCLQVQEGGAQQVAVDPVHEEGEEESEGPHKEVPGVGGDSATCRAPHVFYTSLKNTVPVIKRRSCG